MVLETGVARRGGRNGSLDELLEFIARPALVAERKAKLRGPRRHLPLGGLIAAQLNEISARRSKRRILSCTRSEATARVVAYPLEICNDRSQSRKVSS